MYVRRHGRYLHENYESLKTQQCSHCKAWLLSLVRFLMFYDHNNKEERTTEVYSVNF